MKTVRRDRWTEYVLVRDEQPKCLFEYWVTGSGQFPFDMLRYDAAWPVSSDDAVKLDRGAFVGDRTRSLRSVKLHSYSRPEVDRWSSFGWSVGERAVSKVPF